MNAGNETEDSLKPKWVFDLRTMFYVVSLLAVGLAISPGMFVGSLIVLFFWWCCFAAVRSSSSGMTLGIIALGFILLVCCSGMLMPAVQIVREAARRTACANNMRQLGLALLNSESATGQFPEAAKMVSGNPHSWRVEILPFIEQQNLHGQYDFTQAWDSPKNIKLAQIGIECMMCPSSPHSPKTTYKLVTGPGTIFEKGKPRTLKRIADGASNTIVLIEDSANPIFWTDPNGDLSVEEAVKLLSELDPKNAIHRFDEAYQTTYFGTHVVLADGSIHRIGFNADPELLRNAFLCADGNPADVTELGEPLVVVHYGKIIATVIFVLLALLPLFYLIKEYRQRKSRNVQTDVVVDSTTLS